MKQGNGGVLNGKKVRRKALSWLWLTSIIPAFGTLKWEDCVVRIVSSRSVQATLRVPFSKDGEKDGSVIKSTVCSLGGPGFDSRHPHGPQPSVFPVPSFGLPVCQACMWYIDIHEEKSFRHIK